MSQDFLDFMARTSRERLARARAALPEVQLRRAAQASPAPPPLRLSPQGFDLIAEVKLRSPAAGSLAGTATRSATTEAQIDARVRGYAEAGAAAISVLTEPERFDGALEHLSQAAHSLAGRVPVMRKDFLVDPYQVYEARAHGAGGVLVILRMLPRSALPELLEACAELGLFALLEAFDEQDLAVGADLIAHYAQRVSLLLGVNCRDLGTLQVQPGRLEALGAQLPRAVPCVAESGVQSGADAARLAAAGYDVALVGSALMRSPDPVRLAAQLLAAGRAARPTSSQCGSRSAG